MDNRRLICVIDAEAEASPLASSKGKPKKAKRADASFAQDLRSALPPGSTVTFAFADKCSVPMLSLTAKNKGFCGVLVASNKILDEITGKPKSKRAAYAGSLVEREGVEFVMLPELANLKSTNAGEDLFRRYISKLTHRESWPQTPKFSWVVGAPENLQEIHDLYATATMIAVDIETSKHNLSITMCGFTAVWIEGSKVRMHTCVIPFTFELATLWCAKFLQLPAAKILQNGRYDVAYFFRYGMPMHNWALDTHTMFHAWEAELPRDLGAVAAYLVRESFYWKDMAEGGSSYQQMLYNALDCWNTANAAVAWLIKAPDWAKKNYLMKFPQVFPAHMCEMRGIKRDTERLRKAAQAVDADILQSEARLSACVGLKVFNPRSPAQVGTLLHILTGEKLDSTKEAVLEKLSYGNPITGFFVRQILHIRGRTKLRSTYLDEKKDFKGRHLYSINPCGTETGRWSSGESAFWCGGNTQNIPAGEEVKSTLMADEGWLLAECDGEQAESRDTAYMSGDTKLIAAVSGERDFHSVNCSAFFGVPYDEIYDQVNRKVLRKALRNIGKRVNHGANYCMTAPTLVSTMGLENLDIARKELKLPKFWSYIKIAEFLLQTFHKTYPFLGNVFYKKVWADAKRGHLVGPTGWTRRTRLRIDTNKNDANAAVAHGPQSNNAMRMDMAFWNVFTKIAIHPVHSQNFKLLLQIHDSIFFSFREGHEYLIDAVRKEMEIPITATGADGITRTYTVPAAAKAGKEGKGAKYWSELE